jgi:hypothetical protein
VLTQLSTKVFIADLERGMGLALTSAARTFFASAVDEREIIAI